MHFTNYSQFYKDRMAYGIEYAAEHTVALGFDSVEHIETSEADRVGDVTEMKRILNRHGLPVTCYSVYVQLFTKERDEVERYMLRHVEAAAALGAPYLHHTLFPLYRGDQIENTYEEVLSGIVDTAERIARACNERGIVVLYEPQGAYFNGVEGLGSFLSEMKRRGCEVGICGDLGNSVFVDVPPRDVFRAFAEEIRHVHVKDYLVTDTALPDRKGSRSADGHFIYGSRLGEGSVDLPSCFREIAGVGYDGAISFEIKRSDTEFPNEIGYVKDTMKEAGF